MIRKELAAKSPMRAIEQATDGGLGPGEIGAIVARAGVGKTAILVQIGLDRALQGRQVLHVSLRKTVSRVRDWYDELFRDLAHAFKLEDSMQCYLDVERLRHIHSFVGHPFSVEKLADTTQFLLAHMEFEPKLILLDGFDLAASSPEELQGVSELARDLGAEVWVTALTHRTDPGYYKKGLPEPFAHLADFLHVIVRLDSAPEGVTLAVAKDKVFENFQELPLHLDAQTMVLVETENQ